MEFFLAYLVPILTSTVYMATPLIFASIGGAFSVRGGVMALGLESMMMCGAFCAVLGSYYTSSWAFGLLCGILGGMLIALFHAILSVRYRMNQVISGIGFLGAGTIIVTRRNQVKGLTTAATLWVTACMGLAVGVGFYACALIMYLILIFILLLVNVVDTKYLKIPTNTAIYIEVKREAGLGDVIHFIHEIGWSVRDVKEFPAGRPEILAVRMDLESDQAMRGDLDTLHLLNEQPSVLRLEVRPVH